MKTCNMCKTEYRGSVCLSCGTVYTTTKHTGKWPAAGITPHWRAILRYDALIPDIWVCSSIILGHAWLIGSVTGHGDAFRVMLADVAGWYVFTAFICWLLFFPKSEAMTRHDKRVAAVIGTCGCIALRLILATATGVITGIFIPLCALVAAYVIPLVVVYKLRRSHIEELTGVNIRQVYWDRFAASLEKEWSIDAPKSGKTLASEYFMEEVHDRYAERLNEILVSYVDLT